MKKINLSSVFESLLKGDNKAAEEKFHSYTILESTKINNTLLEDDDFSGDDNGEVNETSITIDLADSDVDPDELNGIFDEILDEQGIEADIVYDEEEKKYTITFDTDEEADNFSDALTDKVTALDLDEITIDDGSDEETEENLDEADYDDNFLGSDEEKAIEDSANDFDLEDFLNEYGQDFNYDNMESPEPEDRELTKGEVVEAIEDYLYKYSDRFFDGDNNRLTREDFKHDSENIFKKTVKPRLESDGFSFTGLNEAEEVEDDLSPLAKEAKARGYELASEGKHVRNINDPLIKDLIAKTGKNVNDRKDVIYGLKAGYEQFERENGQVEEGKDLGKPGKNFAKIEKSAAKEYGSKKAGERVAGAVLSKLRDEHPRKYSESVTEDDEIGDNQSPIDIARRMGYDAAKDGNENKFNAELRSLMNDKAGDAQREDIHKAYIEGMDSYHDESKVKEAVEQDDTINFSFPSDGDSYVVDKIENKMDRLGLDYEVTRNEIEDGRRYFQVEFGSTEDSEEAYQMIEKLIDALDIEDYDLTTGEEIMEDSENEYGHITVLVNEDHSFEIEEVIRDFDGTKITTKEYNDEDSNGDVVEVCAYFYDLNKVEEAKRHIENMDGVVDIDVSYGEDLDEDSDIDTVEDECDDDKLDLILSKISELEAQIDSISDEAGTAEDDALDAEEDDVESELPEDGEDDYENVSEDYKLEPVKTEPNVDGEEVGYGKKINGNDDSPMTDVDKLKLDINDKGIQSPSKNNAKGYPSFPKPTLGKTPVSGEVKNAEQKLEKVNPDDKKALVNKSQGKENDESVLGNGTIAESRKRVLRKRK